MKKLFVLFLLISSVALNAMQENQGDKLEELRRAVYESDQEKVLNLIQSGVDLNEERQGTTILTYAIFELKRSMCKLLIEHGAKEIKLINSSYEREIALGMCIARMMSPQRQDWEIKLFDKWREWHELSKPGESQEKRDLRSRITTLCMQSCL